MFTAALDGLVDRFGLAGERLGAVVGGAVLKHSRDFNLMRECVLGTRCRPTPRPSTCSRPAAPACSPPSPPPTASRPAGTRSAAAGGVDTTSDAPIAFGDDLRRVLLGLRRSKSNVDRLKLVGKLPARARRGDPHQRRAAHRAVDGRARRHHRQADGHQAGRPGRAGRGQPPQHGGRLRPRLLRRPGHARSSGSTATTTCGPTPRPRSWPSSSRCSASSNGDATMTAGNSTPLTDGASVALLASEEWAADARLPVLAYFVDARDRGGRLRQRRRRPADGADLCGAAAAGPQWADAAGLRLLRDPRGVRVGGAGARWPAGSPRSTARSGWASTPRSARSTGRSSTSTARRWRPATRSPPPAGGSSRSWPSSSRRRRPQRGRRCAGLISICAAGGQGVTAILEA